MPDLTNPLVSKSLTITRRNQRRTTKLLKRNAAMLAEVMPPVIIFDSLRLLNDDNLVWGELETVRKPLAKLVASIMVYPLLRPELVEFCRSLFDGVNDSTISSETE